MKQWWAALKPTERRWAVGIGLVVFLVFNYFFVWSHFGDLKKDNARMDEANKKIGFYDKELRHEAEYKRKLSELQSDGSSVLPEDQAIDFVHFYNSRAISNRVVVANSGPLVTRTNDFFLEQQMGINVAADETNLVKFLYDLGAGNSMMRVRTMSLHPDPSHMQLNASITIVASYQKKAPARSTIVATNAPAKVAAAAPKPAPPAPVIKPAAPAATPVAVHTNKFSTPFSRPTATNKSGIFNPKRP